MNENRDFYLRNMGIGEIWRSREMSVAASIAPDLASVNPVCGIDLLVLGEFPDSEAVTPDVEKLFANIVAAFDLNEERQLQQLTWLDLKSSGDADGDDAARYRASFKAAVEAARPRAILVFGQRAAQVLLDAHGDETLENWRSSLQVFQDVPVIVTHAPTYLLTYPEGKRETWMDLCRAKAFLS